LNKKTEKLRERIEVKINRFDTFREEYSYATFAQEILLVCREEGLRFVELPAGYTDEGIEEIEL